jgi:ABC-type nitrate/sulfonate/bicarbonate transport system substrate-binding protein
MEQVRKFFILLILIIVVSTTGYFIYRSLNKSSEEAETNSQKVRVQLQWFDGAQFCGMYVAASKGFYRDEGLNVELKSGSFDIVPTAVLLNGDVEIAMGTGDQVLLTRADSTKEPIKAIGTVFNRSLAVFMAKKNVVRTIQDFEGKIVGVYPNFDTDNILQAIIKKQNLDPKKIKIVPAAGTLDPFEKGEMDIFPSYILNEPIEAQERKIDYVLFRPDNLGVFFYSDTYFVKEDYYNDNKDVLRRFLRATSKGWSYCKDNRDESINILMNRLNRPDQDGRIKDKERRALDVILNTYIGDGEKNRPLYMRRDKWNQMQDALQSIGKLPVGVDYITDLCDFEIVE